jgi:RNA polymerase sigma-70 factor (ECF subfamily)
MLQPNNEIDAFLAQVEKRGYLMAEIATRSPEDALDLMQDAMITFVQRYALHNSDEWPPLFFRILQNRIRDWYRWNKVRNKWRVWFGNADNIDENDNINFIENQPETKSNNPLNIINNDCFSDALIEALKLLPFRQQQVFMLRIWEGLSVIQTAQIMNCSQGSVKTHLSRATKVLREKLEDFR